MSSSCSNGGDDLVTSDWWPRPCVRDPLSLHEQLLQQWWWRPGDQWLAAKTLCPGPSGSVSAIWFLPSSFLFLSLDAASPFILINSSSLFIYNSITETLFYWISLSLYIYPQQNYVSYLFWVGHSNSFTLQLQLFFLCISTIKNNYNDINNGILLHVNIQYEVNI